MFPHVTPVRLPSRNGQLEGVTSISTRDVRLMGTRSIKVNPLVDFHRFADFISLPKDDTRFSNIRLLK
jgi:hypothetical protein